MEPEPSIDTLVPIVRDLVRWLGDGRVRYAIIGGVACALLGRPRTTRDVDAVVFVQPEDWKPLLDSGARYGFEPRIPDPLEFAHKSRVLLLKHGSSGITADISLGALPFEDELIDRAIQANFEGVNVPLATPEDLIVMKALAGRGVDMQDMQNLLDANPDVDLRRVRRWTKRFAEGLEMPEILERLEQILKRRK